MFIPPLTVVEYFFEFYVVMNSQLPTINNEIRKFALRKYPRKIENFLRIISKSLECTLLETFLKIISSSSSAFFFFFICKQIGFFFFVSLSGLRLLPGCHPVVSGVFWWSYVLLVFYPRDPYYSAFEYSLLDPVMDAVDSTNSPFSAHKCTTSFLAQYLISVISIICFALNVSGLVIVVYISMSLIAVL